MQLTRSIDDSKILFLDAECVSGESDYELLSPDMQALWRHKTKSILRTSEFTEEEASEAYKNNAGIYAEFGKIVCISVGFIFLDKANNTKSIKLKSFAGPDEMILLQDFAGLLAQYYPDANKSFICGHNIKEFDIPYICRRMLVNGIELPAIIDVAGKKPWETAHFLDTMEMWKFGDRKSFTSLKLLAAVLGFPSPKDDIDGSEVGRVYWEESDIDRISLYCEKDVLATAQLYLRLSLKPLLNTDSVVHVS
ncbi:MAG: 3'-5' exonuclease [Saprospiraceae bacterium]|nr:3'-5' exonuclease [Saprospiraceae bacterium]